MGQAIKNRLGPQILAYFEHQPSNFDPNPVGLSEKGDQNPLVNHHLPYLHDQFDVFPVLRQTNFDWSLATQREANLTAGMIVNSLGTGVVPNTNGFTRQLVFELLQQN